MPSERDELIAKWNGMHPRQRYFIIYDELCKAWEDEIRSGGDLGKRLLKDAEFYAKSDSKSNFDQLPDGIQNHVLRGLSSKYAMRQNYKERWIPDRRVEYDEYPAKSRIHIGDYVLVYSMDKSVPTGYGRIIGIHMARDPIDSTANVQLANGRKGTVGYYQLQKVDAKAVKKRLSYNEWQRLLTMMIGEEIGDLANSRI